MNNILVTGGAGFVGSHLCERLVSMGYTVTSLDNYSTGTADNHVDGVTYLSGSTKYINLLVDFTPDTIFHLGEYSRVEQSFQEPRKIFEYNTQGTFEVLEFAVKNSCKLIYAGSSTKFADKKDYTPSPYAWSKATNTDLVQKYGEWYGLNYAITYFYNVYGPREIKTGPYATLIAKYIELHKQGKKLPVVLPGTQVRNFTHVNDIIDGLVLVGQQGSGDDYGIGSDEAFTINEVASLFNSDVEYLPERSGNRMAAKVRNKKLKKLGWKCKHSLENYINGIIR